MTFSFRTAAVAADPDVAGTGLVVTDPAGAHTTGIHDNCTNFNKRYPHGDLDRDNDRIACEKA